MINKVYLLSSRLMHTVILASTEPMNEQINKVYLLSSRSMHTVKVKVTLLRVTIKPMRITMINSELFLPVVVTLISRSNRERDVAQR